MPDRPPRAVEAALEQLDLDSRTSERLIQAVADSADPGDGIWDRLLPILEATPEIAASDLMIKRAVAVAASSRALSQTLSRNPGLLEGVSEPATLTDRLRSILISIAGDDLSGALSMEDAVARFSDAVDHLVQWALEAAVGEISERHPVARELPFAVIAMGKWGARELNYYSDIDLVFVHESVPGSETESRSAALAIASKLVALLSSPTFDGTVLNVDVDLRPEGAMGPLSRSLDSYRSYYDRWAEAWELQALLKVRAAAGDRDLGNRFQALANHVVWETGLTVDALRNIRQLKTQTEAGADSNDIKRSRGGIRDIEFTIQLLQLVHGKFDADLRMTSTLEAIRALGAHGYIEPDEADRLIDSYTFLRDLEHRIQLWDLHQTHRLPPSSEARARIGRSLGFREDPETQLLQRLSEVKAAVRDLHERLYFRPMLDALAGVATARLDRAGAALRLEALGFRDVVGATKALEELTTGLSRKSRVMHQVLPLMIDWLSQSPDPDLGLDQLRVLLAHTSDHSTLVRLLQVNPLAGERLCILLGTGRLLGELMDRIPEFIPRLADDTLIRDVRASPDAEDRLIALLRSRPDEDAQIGTIRRFARRRKLRIAARDVLGEASTELTLRSLSDTADTAVRAGLHVAAGGSNHGFGIIAMGKWGAAEMSYGSDLDLMYVFDEMERPQALSLTGELDRVLAQPSRHGVAYELDAGLRPEGRKGPMARSFDSFERYYSEWAEPWELLALVKARPAVGDPRILEQFTDLTYRTLWSDRLPDDFAHQIRLIKARVESERIPPGEDPDFHLKLGPGGLSDVEFVTQLLQLRHGALLSDLRVSSTFGALQALRDMDVLAGSDFTALKDSYLFCTRVRLRLHLQSGRKSNALPTDQDANARLASSLGFDRTSELREQYRRHTRKARRVFERLFYE